MYHCIFWYLAILKYINHILAPLILLTLLLQLGRLFLLEAVTEHLYEKWDIPETLVLQSVPCTWSATYLWKSAATVQKGKCLAIKLKRQRIYLHIGYHPQCKPGPYKTIESIYNTEIALIIWDCLTAVLHEDIHIFLIFERMQRSSIK